MSKRTIHLDKDIHEKLKQYADNTGMKMYFLINKIVEEYLEKETHILDNKCNNLMQK